MISEVSVKNTLSIGRFFERVCKNAGRSGVGLGLLEAACQ